jgi:hypothetical protein
MYQKIKTLSDALLEFDYLLKKHPDVPESLSVFTQFVRYFLRTKTSGEELPSVEVMTVLKNEKPNVFYLMKKQSKNNVVMSMLTNIEMDMEEAENRLNRLKRRIS